VLGVDTYVFLNVDILAGLHLVVSGVLLIGFRYIVQAVSNQRFLTCALQLQTCMCSQLLPEFGFADSEMAPVRKTPFQVTAVAEITRCSFHH
jgi:hypothetical protein